jgi:hypothetical protein
VHADEEPLLAPGVEVHTWGASEDRMYYIASQPSGGIGHVPNGDPGAGPFEPGQEFEVGFLEFIDDASSVFANFEPDDVFYLVEDPDAPLVNIPDAFDAVRVVAVERVDDEDDGFTLWRATLKRTDLELLPEIYTTASFCTGTSTHVDPPVQRTRLFSVDGDEVDAAERDTHEQPIRANELTLSEGIVTFSGQIAGHVLKPSLSLRLRHGHVEAGAAFDTDLTVAAELRAEDEVTLDPERVVMWQHCFPMPSLPAGPVEIPMSLGITQDLGMQGSMGAGALVGFEKHWESGFSILCQGGPGVPESCSSEGHRNPTPIQWTPPQFTESTGYEVRVDTALLALLRVGDAACATGPGLSLDTKAYMGTGVSPADDPWWSAGYGLEVSAALDLDLLGLDIARYETDLFAVEEDASDSSQVPPTSSAASGARSSGEDQRWAVAIDDTTVPNGVSTTSIAALPDGASIAIATEAVGGRNPIVKLDRFGALVWVKEFDKKVLRVRALPDGTVIALGVNAWIARIDADGNLIWSFDAEISRTDFEYARCTLADVVPLERAPGIYDYVGVGAIGTNLVTTVDACAFRVNADGTLAWQRIYAGERGQRFYGAVETRDGDVVAVGYDLWYYVGNRSVPLFARLDAATGDVLWWKGMPMTRGADLRAVAEASDGTLYGVGNASGIIFSTGAAVVARIAPDGSDARHALLFQDEEWEVAQDDGWNGVFGISDFEPWIDTAGGDTAYDTWFEIAPSGDGFVLAGHTGLGVNTAGRAAKINANLGVEWMTTFDGADTDWLTGVAAASDGLFVSGFSESLPEADGGSGENQLWVMKLPFSGSLEFLPEVAMTTRYVSPGVRFSSTDPGVNPIADASVDIAYAYEDPVVVSTGPNPGLLVTASPYCVKLLTETGSVSTLDGCPD